jgi:hypothetical protein
MTASARHYTIEEANALLPSVRSILLQLAVERRRYAEAHAALHALLRGNGDPSHAAEVARNEEAVASVRAGMEALGEHLAALGVELRDLEIGLVDFPGQRDGEPVWLCWRLEDPTVAFWHTRREGFANRKPW